MEELIFHSSLESILIRSIKVPTKMIEHARVHAHNLNLHMGHKEREELAFSNRQQGVSGSVERFVEAACLDT